MLALTSVNSVISAFVVVWKKTTSFVSSDMNCFELSLTKLNSRISARSRMTKAELLPFTGLGKSVGFGVLTGLGGSIGMQLAIFSIINTFARYDAC